ncbi:MAG: hypothetical protein K2Q45_06575 [Nitrosomonas sp.]|nr:hypothetical protein [Nitrosomonas sp.]
MQKPFTLAEKVNVAVGLSLLSFVFVVAAFILALTYGLTNANSIHDNAIIAKSQTDMLKLEVYNALMNTSSSSSVHIESIVRNGTFDWITINNNLVVARQTSNYTLKFIQIGPLGFNLLVLNPPAVPLAIDVDSNNWSFQLENFLPFVDQLLVIPQGDVDFPNGPVFLRMTSSNAKKMSVSGGCLDIPYSGYGQVLAGGCVISGAAKSFGNFGGNIFELGVNALQVYSNDITDISQYVFRASIATNPSERNLLIGQTFTITSPWEFILPTV